MADLQDVKKVVVDYYGEDRVDMTNDYIMIYFPEVTVTNENNRSVVITKLYVKIPMCSDGTMGGIFRMNRSEYTKEQYYSDYMHSHICGIPGNKINFLEPCLGTGPIRTTISNLCNEADLSLWELFCFELDLYVKTESLAGVPYRRLESIGILNNNRKYSLPERSSLNYIATDCILEKRQVGNIIHSFIKYLIKQDLNYIYHNGIVSFGYSNNDLAIIISNYFIKYFNSKHPGYRKENLLDYNTLLLECILNKGNLYLKAPSGGGNHLIGTPLWIFKGERVTFNIIEEEETTDNSLLLLRPFVVSYITQTILKTLNIYYGKVRTDKAAYIL